MIHNRIRLLGFLAALPFALILLQLARLQLFEENHEHYRELAEHLKAIPTSPRRGRILSSDHQVLAENRQAFHIEFRYFELNPREKPLRRIVSILAARGTPLARDDIENALLELVSPAEVERLAAGPLDASPQWMPLIRGLAPTVSDRLESSLRTYDDLFRVHPTQPEGHLDNDPRAAAGDSATERGSSFVLWFSPPRVMHREITLRRLADLLAWSPARSERRNSGAAKPRELGERVTATLAKIERLAQREARQLEKRGGSPTSVRKKLGAARDAHLRNPWRLAGNVAAAVVTAVEYFPEVFAGLEVVSTTARHYPLGDRFATIAGQVRSAREKDLARLREEGRLVSSSREIPDLAEFRARRGSLVTALESLGSGGLERVYDDHLRGKLGLQIVRTEPSGRTREVEHEETPVDGGDLHTTLDAELQQLLLEALAARVRPQGGSQPGTAGSAVVLDIQTGAVLASAGFPSYDPNRLYERGYAFPEKDSELEKQWGAQTRSWLLDRPTLQPLYPGSLFKLIAAVAALESRGEDGERWKPSTRYSCHHWFELNKKLRCSAKNGHTPTRTVDLAQAIKFSCNNYFYHLAYEHLGAEALQAWAARFGLGRATGVDLHGGGLHQGTDSGGGHRFESGFLASPETVAGFEVCHYGIGQVHVQATPMQMVRFMASIARDDGVLPRPYFVAPRTDVAPERVVLRPETLAVLRESLWRVAHETGGTAADANLRLREYRVGLKTGTADVVSKKGGENIAWILGYAPANAPDETEVRTPRIAFVVVVEETDLHGGDACAPVVRTLLDYFVEQDPEAYLRDPIAGGPDSSLRPQSSLQGRLVRGGH